MTGKGTMQAVKEASPLAQLATVLVLSIVLVVQQQGAMAGQSSRPAADKEVMDTRLGSIQSTLDKIDAKLDPLLRDVAALKIRVGALEQNEGSGQ